MPTTLTWVGGEFVEVSLVEVISVEVSLLDRIEGKRRGRRDAYVEMLPHSLRAHIQQLLHVVEDGWTANQS